MTNQGKNGDEDKKKCKNEFNFEFYLSKVGNMAIFLKIWEKKILTDFLKIFLTNRGKNEIEDEKI